jgi:fumarate reductase subunit C
MKTYRKKMTIFWWTRKKSYLRFILRELTSLAVAFFTIEMIYLFWSLKEGPDVYHEFMELLRSPVLVFLNLVAMAGLLFHSITWFNLSAKAIVVKIGKARIPGKLVASVNYIAWIIISAVIVWILY